MELNDCSANTSCWPPRVFPDSQQYSFHKHESQYQTQDLMVQRSESFSFESMPCWFNNYTSNDVYCQGSVINVPFSWEYKPGLAKVTHHHHHHDLTENSRENGIGKLVLQPPPSYNLSFGTRSGDATNIHLGQICAIKPSQRRASSFRMENYSYKEEDPFVEAYKKCTKSPFMILQSSNCNNNSGQKSNNGSWLSIRKYMNIFSCKYAGNVSIENSVCSYNDVKGVEKLR